MKKNFFFQLFLMSCLFGSIFSCTKENISPTPILDNGVTFRNEIDFHTDYHPSLGELHNEGLNELINFSGISPSFTPQENISLIDDYYLSTIGTIVSPAVESYFSKNEEQEIIFTFEPFTYLEAHQADFSPYLYEQVYTLLSSTYNAKDDVDAVLSIIIETRENVLNDNNYEMNDAILFTNMLYVFESSVNYWSNNDDDQGAQAYGVNEEDYWKIAGADWLNGLRAGLVTMNPVGALGGLVFGSAMAVLMLWHL